MQNAGIFLTDEATSLAGVSPVLGVMDGMLHLYHAFDALADELSKDLGIPLCAMCGHCCENNVPVAYGLEAVFALSCLLGQGKLSDVLYRAGAWLVDNHRQAPTRESLTLDKVTSGLEQKLQDEFLALAAAPCPFLQDKKCLIYSCRPLVCRALGVTRTPPPKCKRPIGKGETMTQRSIVPEYVSAMLRQAVDEVLKYVPKPTWAMAGFLPSLLVGIAHPSEYRNFVESGSISSAKILVTNPSMGILWQEQVETLMKKDINSHMVVARR